MKTRNLIAGCAGLLACNLPSHSQAYSVNMTELSDTQLYVTMDLPGYPTFSER